MPRYDPKRIESKWQQEWKVRRTFATRETLSGKGKLYVLDMFPYPSGDGLHVGHPEGYTATDIVCRYNRMRGKDVLHPMGWDAFGLPAEQHAKKTGTHPRTTTYKNIDTFRRQLQMLGFSYDWDREFSTTDPDYFRWTQWIFLVLFDTWHDRESEWVGADGRKRKGRGRPIAELPIPDDVREQGIEAVRRYQDKHRLAYQSFAPVNWCEALGTVLANEEVIDGKSERGGHPVTRHCAPPMDAPHHRIRRSTAGGIGRTGLERVDQDSAAELDWPQRGGRSRFLHRQKRGDRRRARLRGMETDSNRHGFPAKSRAKTFCGFIPRGPTRCSARPTWCSLPSMPSSID